MGNASWTETVAEGEHSRSLVAPIGGMSAVEVRDGSAISLYSESGASGSGDSTIAACGDQLIRVVPSMSENWCHGMICHVGDTTPVSLGENWSSATNCAGTIVHSNGAAGGESSNDYFVEVSKVQIAVVKRPVSIRTDFLEFPDSNDMLQDQAHKGHQFVNEVAVVVADVAKNDAPSSDGNAACRHHRMSNGGQVTIFVTCRGKENVQDVVHVSIHDFHDSDGLEGVAWSWASFDVDGTFEGSHWPSSVTSEVQLLGEAHCTCLAALPMGWYETDVAEGWWPVLAGSVLQEQVRTCSDRTSLDGVSVECMSAPLSHWSSEDGATDRFGVNARPATLEDDGSRLAAPLCVTGYCAGTSYHGTSHRVETGPIHDETSSPHHFGVMSAYGGFVDVVFMLIVVLLDVIVVFVPALNVIELLLSSECTPGRQDGASRGNDPPLLKGE